MKRRVHQSFCKPVLVLGCEREPGAYTFAAGAAFIALGISRIELWLIGFGVCIFLFVVPTLQQIAKYDPQAFAAYRRYLRYNSTYPARSEP